MSLKRITKPEQTSFHSNFPGERKHKILPKLNSLILTRLRVIIFFSAVVNACLLIPVRAILCWSTLISGTLTIPLVKSHTKAIILTQTQLVDYSYKVSS